MVKLGRLSWAAMLLAVLLPVLAACQSGGSLPEARLAVDVPTELIAGETAAWTVSWENFGYGPYKVAIDMGGGMTADLPDASAAASPFTASFTPVADEYAQTQSYTYSVTVTDSRAAPLSASGSYAVYTPPPEPPAIDNTTLVNNKLTVSVSSPAAVPLTVTVTEPPGLIADSTSKAVPASVGEATFTWFLTDFINGNDRDTTITAADDYGGTDTATAELGAIYASIPAGTLLAVPDKTEVGVNEPVTITVISSQFPADAPFRNAGIMRLTLAAGVEYVPYSFNIGAPGGEWSAFDGIWSRFDPVPDYLLMPDGIADGIADWDLPDLAEYPGRVRFDMLFTPTTDTAITSGGALFNFQVTAPQPMTCRLGFLEYNENPIGLEDIELTNYADEQYNLHHWLDSENENPAVPNSFNVTN